MVKVSVYVWILCKCRECVCVFAVTWGIKTKTSEQFVFYVCVCVEWLCVL